MASAEKWHETPRFSIIIPTYNEERLLPSLLKSIDDQTLREFEIIISDDKSTDRTRDIAQQFGARIIVNDQIGEYPSRNAAARVAKGSVLVFTGADTRMPRNMLRLVASKFDQDGKLAGLYCPTYPYDGAPWAKVGFVLWYALTTMLYLVTREANASGAFFAVRSDVFRETKGFQNVAHADSSLSRQLSKNFRVRPGLGLLIFVSGRRTKMGILGFNRYHIAMVIDVFFRFLRNSQWLRAERNHRIVRHTRSKSVGG